MQKLSIHICGTAEKLLLRFKHKIVFLKLTYYTTICGLSKYAMITHAVFLLAETIAVQSVYLIVIINLSQWPSQGEYLCRGYSATCHLNSI